LDALLDVLAQVIQVHVAGVAFVPSVIAFLILDNTYRENKLILHRGNADLWQVHI
jgi:uncharacterized membrane protein